MPISPWVVGQLSPTWTLQLMRDNRVMDLTGVTTGQLSLIIYTASKAVASNSPGAGTFTIPTGGTYPGVVTYAPAAADVATAGTYYVRVKINFNGTTPDFSDYIQWVINT